MMPSEPHDPVSSLTRSNPATFFTTRPPPRAMSPSPATNSMPRMLSRTSPNPCASGPLDAVAMVAPNDPWALPNGSRARTCPFGRVTSSMSSSEMPACAVSVRLPGSYSMTRRIECVPSVTACESTGRPASNHVSAPAGRIVLPDDTTCPMAEERSAAAGTSMRSRTVPSGIPPLCQRGVSLMAPPCALTLARPAPRSTPYTNAPEQPFPDSIGDPDRTPFAAGTWLPANPC